MRPLEEILKTMRDAVVDFDEAGVRSAAEALLEEGYNPLDGILHGLTAGMETVGKLFKSQEYFVPEVLLCAEAMTAGLEILRPHLPTAETKTEGTIVLGTVQGDVHDLGKNIVKMMLEIGGFTVCDLGYNVPHDRFVDEMMRTDADLVGISAMMTTTMMAMKGLIQKVKQAKPGVGVLIGGAPITREIVKMFKADGYSESAAEVLEEARRVMATIKAG
jgi:corrinoid protein of di/trimethylamine methyltransferase